MLRTFLLLCQLGITHVYSQTIPVTEEPPFVTEFYNNFTMIPDGFPFGLVNVFDMMISQSDMDSFFKDFSYLAYTLDDSTDSGFTSYVDQTLGFVRDGVCPREGRCSFILGCSCDASFRKLGSQCEELPCQIIQHVYDNAARAVAELSEVTTVEGLMRWVSDNIFTALRMICPCRRSVVNAAAMCVLKYDGEFTYDAGVSKMVRETAAQLDMQNIKASLRALIGIFCAKDGNCIAEYGDMLTEQAAMFDRSLDPEYPEECESYRRLSDVIGEGIMMMSENIDSTIINIAHRIAEEFWCGNERCASHLDRTLNTCCRGVVHDKFNMKALEAMLKAAGSIVNMVDETGDLAGFGNLDRETKKKILESINPRKMCWKHYQKNTCA